MKLFTVTISCSLLLLIAGCGSQSVQVTKYCDHSQIKNIKIDSFDSSDQIAVKLMSRAMEVELCENNYSVSDSNAQAILNGTISVTPATWSAPLFINSSIVDLRDSTGRLIAKFEYEPRPGAGVWWYGKTPKEMGKFVGSKISNYLKENGTDKSR